MESDGRLSGSWFVSQRERRLWAMTLVVVVAIYSTLGLARTLADELRNRELLDSVFVAATLLILMAVVAFAWQAKPATIEIGVALGIIAVYLLVAVRMALPEERTHLIEYGVVAAFIHQAVSERRRHGMPTVWPAAAALVLATLVGTVDELLQLVIPSRVFDPVDIFVNFVSALMAVLTIEVMSWARRIFRADGL